MHKYTFPAVSPHHKHQQHHHHNVNCSIHHSAQQAASQPTKQHQGDEIAPGIQLTVRVVYLKSRERALATPYTCFTTPYVASSLLAYDWSSFRTCCPPRFGIQTPTPCSTKEHLVASSLHDFNSSFPFFFFLFYCYFFSILHPATRARWMGMCFGTIKKNIFFRNCFLFGVRTIEILIWMSFQWCQKMQQQQRQ